MKSLKVRLDPLTLIAMTIAFFFADSGTINIAQFAVPEYPRILTEAPEIEGRLITAEEVARLAMLKSLHVKIAGLDLEAERTRVMEEESQWDTELGLDFTYDWEEEQQRSTVSGERTKTGEANAALSKKFPTGLETGLFYENSRTSSPSGFASLDPSYQSNARIELRQPILKNAFGLIDRSEVKIVKLDVAQFTEETLDKIEQAVFDARSAYWDYVKAYLNVEAERKNYEAARRFFEIIRDQIETGFAEEPDYFAAEANLRHRMQGLLRARLDAGLAMNELKLALSMLEGVIPDYRPGDSSAPVAHEAVFDGAFLHRRDYKKKILEIKQKGIEVKMNRNKRWPTLDVVGKYGTNALDRDHKDTQGEAFGFNHPEYYLGFEVTIPFENREARAQARRSALEKERLLLELRQLEIRIALEAENAVTELQIQESVASQARQIEELERRKLEAEERQFEVGRSSSQTVIDYQEDRIEAAKQRIAAEVDLEKAKDQVWLTQHRLLKELGLTE